MTSKQKIVVCYRESRRIFWLRHYLNRIVPRFKRRGVIPIQPRLCAFPNDLIGREMAVAGLYEMAGIHAVKYLCERGVIEAPDTAVFMDIGANIGTYTVSLAGCFGKVWSFEPHPFTSRLLGLNIELNSISNAIVFQKALSNRDGSAALMDAGLDNVGASSLEQNRIPDHLHDGKSYQVELARGDNLLADYKDRVAFIKIDVEGHESAAIEGLVGVIGTNMPIIAFEANSREDSEKLRQRLQDLGYASFMALDFYPQFRWLALRVLMLTLFGVRHVLRPIENLRTQNYSLVFALTEAQAKTLADDVAS